MRSSLHELRWARTIRSVRPASYPGIALTYPLPLAAAAVLLARDKRVALPLLLVAARLRLGLHVRARAALGGHDGRHAALIPLRDLLGAAVWLCGFLGGAVLWRGAAIAIARDGSLPRAKR